MKTNRKSMFLLFIVLIGGILRVLCCFWGYPYQLHPDEPTIVENAIDIIQRNSYLPEVYNRPDHFEIKCCAALFEIFSRIHFGGVKASYTFASHEMIYYVIARLFTAFWGIAMIPLTFLFVERICDRAKWIATIMVALFPTFVQHSAYSTPDIPLTFFILLACYISLIYLEKPDFRMLIAMDVICGISITIKYTGAIIAIWIAVVVIYSGIKNHEYKRIIVGAVTSVIVVFGVSFVIAPNIFINLDKTIEILRFESRNQQLAADGLSTFGNFVYYYRCLFETIGFEALIPFVIGIGYLVKIKKVFSAFGMGIIYWGCMSALALHWERWGMPIYVFMLIVIAIGIEVLIRSFNNIGVRTVILAFSAVLFLNLFVSSILIVQRNTIKDARVLTREWCEANSINEDNSSYDDYTPFGMNGRVNTKWKIRSNGETFEVADGVSYVVVNENMRDMYMADKENYPNEVSWYNFVMENCQLIYEINGAYGSHTNYASTNIIFGIRSLREGVKKDAVGHSIAIYKL